MVTLTRSTGLPFPEYLPNMPLLLDFFSRTPLRVQLWAAALFSFGTVRISQGSNDFKKSLLNFHGRRESKS